MMAGAAMAVIRGPDEFAGAMAGGRCGSGAGRGGEGVNVCSAGWDEFPAECVVAPTLEEWLAIDSFEAFVEAKVAPVSRREGFCVVRSPPGWQAVARGRGGAVRAALDAGFVIPEPIRQESRGRGRDGIFTQVHTEMRGMSLRDFMRLAESRQAGAPDAGKDGEEAVERAFWKHLQYDAPLYGADTVGTLFDGTSLPEGMQVPKLADATLLRRVAEGSRAGGSEGRGADQGEGAAQGDGGEVRGIRIAGVNVSSLYFGMWRSCFAWHTEDMDLWSVNLLHEGANKFWYCVPPAYSARFEAMARALAPELAQECPRFLRHKNVLISPRRLREFGIPFRRFIQRPGDWVFNHPGAYHCGFNAGFNAAESINFATPEWVSLGRRTGFCTCRPDTVRLDMRLWKDVPDVGPAPRAARRPGGARGKTSKDARATALAPAPARKQHKRKRAPPSSRPRIHSAQRPSQGPCDTPEGLTRPSAGHSSPP